MIVLSSLSLRPALPGVTVGTVVPTIPRRELRVVLEVSAVESSIDDI